ncbi:MAG: hypothetical protein B7Z69_01420 [Actinobacteria bacterium 21-73-9]|nr:MAG: hypothetical protein B7Z69_01420 [Actinobacteria bacterium 21-73-9]
MLLIFLALLWLALLTPIAVRKFREVRSERSIESFHAEHEILSRQGYAVAPVHRLDEYEETPAPVATRGPSAYAPRRPRLTLVHPEDTYRSLESRGSWEEWSEDYDFDHDERVAVGHYGAPRSTARATPRPTSASPYARAYSTFPSESSLAYDEPPLRQTSTRVQRRRITVGLVGSAVFFSALAFVTSISLVADLAYLAWLLLVAYVALALFAVSQGYLSVGTRTPSRREYPSRAAYAPESYEDGPLPAASDGWDRWNEQWDERDERDEWAEVPSRSVSYGARRAFG